MSDVSWDTRSGYSIVGWSTEDGATNSNFTLDSDEITADTTLYAVWGQKVTVTFNANYSGADPSTSEVEIDVNASVAEASVPSFERSGYEIASWNTQANGSGTNVTPTSYTFSENTTLYAIWEPADGQDTYTLTFDTVLDGATVTPSSISVVQGDSIAMSQIPDDPVLDGYTFDGWYASASISDTTELFTTEDDYTLSEDTTVYAHWTYNEENADAVKVSFYMNDGNSNAAYLTVSVKSGTSLGNMMPEDPEISGYSFDGWNTSSTGEGSEFTSSTAVTSEYASVYAQWSEDIKVSYDVNSGDTAAPDSVSGASSKTYSNPETDPTREHYKFLGWNTKQNGSGTYIYDSDDGKSTYCSTFGDVYTAAGGESASITLYAQWGAVTADSDVDDEPMDPTALGVVVTFDSCAPSDEENVVDANPKYKYPYLGEAIGDGNMPENPSRDDYEFVGWYTKPGGQGTQVTATTEITAALGATLIDSDDISKGYEITLYAAWSVSAELGPTETVTVTFYDNIGGQGENTNKVYQVTIVKGDALGFVPETSVTNEFANGVYYDNVGWSTEASNEDADADVFDADTTVSEDTSVYIRWKLYVDIILQGTGTSTYDGKAVDPTFDVVKMTSDASADTETYIYEDTAASNLTEFTFIYKKGNAEQSSILNAGTYSIDANVATADLEKAGLEVNILDPDTYTVGKAELTVGYGEGKDSTYLKQKAGEADVTDLFKITGYVEADYADYAAGTLNDGVAATITYYSWTPEDDDDKTIEIAELSETSITTESDEGYYVVVVTPTDNYEVKYVNVTVYPDETGTESELPVYSAGTDGTNIYFQIAASDPTISSMTIKEVDSTGTATSTDADISPEFTTENTTYTVTAGYDAEEQTFSGAEGLAITLGTENTETVKVTYTDSNGDEQTKYVTVSGDTTTITIDDLDIGESTITITLLSEEDNEDEGTATYTLNVKLYTTPKIVLNYGNSPYGEIMKDDTITDKDAAKTAFTKNNSFTSQYCPSGYSTSLLYQPRAWVNIASVTNITDEEQADIENAEINMDRNEYALFAYQAATFADPGFTAYDSLGNEIDPEETKITRSIKVFKMTGMDAAVGEYKTYTIEDTNDECTLSSYIVDSQLIRPDVYSMTYSFVDPETGYTSDDGIATRKVVLLALRGDTDLNNSINTADRSNIINYVKALDIISQDTDEVPLSTRLLYYYRAVDVDLNASINTADLSGIVNHVKGTDLEQLYK